MRMKIDFSMWGKALTTMPRVDRLQWQTLDWVSRWLLATRSAVLIMTFMASALAGLMAWRNGMFHLDLWILLTIGLIFAHATNNLLNDYIDSAKGIDKANYYRNRYGVHVIEDKLMSKSGFWFLTIVTASIAIVAGLLLVDMRQGITLSLMLAGAFFVLFYTWPLKYFGLGEPAVLLVWGPLMIGGGYFVITGQWSWSVTWLSVLFGLGPTTVLFGKHIDKMVADEQKKVRTMPVLLGDKLARKVAQSLLVAQYVLPLYLVASGWFNWLLLLVWLNIPNFITTYQKFAFSKPDEAPADYPDGAWPLWFSALAFAHNRRYSILFLIAVAGEIILKNYFTV